MKTKEDFTIFNTTRDDLDIILWIFQQAIDLQGKSGYKVWEGIDKITLLKDIDNGHQYKIVKDSKVLCIFSVQYKDPFIWRERDQDDAIYLHRVVVNPDYKGQKQFLKVLNWAKEVAEERNLRFVRMDTWADNEKIIEYYKSFGFEFFENYTTADTPELPVHNRNLNVALLEIDLFKNKEK